MISIQSIISEIDTLTPISQIMNQVLSLSKDPKSSMSDIADVIVYDPIITASLIKTCNSAYFALPRRVNSVKDAIVLLGLNRVIDLVLIKSVSENLIKAQAGYGLHEGELWRYSVTTAIMARDLAERKRAPDTQLIFTASLLKDIGKIILDRFVAGAIDRIDGLVRDHKYSFHEAEKEVIGLDHAELGGLIAEKWNFSPKMTFIITNHHITDLSALEDFETAIVYLSEIAAMMAGVGSGSDGLAYRFHESALECLKVSEEEFQGIIASFAENYHNVKELLDIV